VGNVYNLGGNSNVLDSNRININEFRTHVLNMRSEFIGGGKEICTYKTSN